MAQGYLPYLGSAGLKETEPREGEGLSVEETFMGAGEGGEGGGSPNSALD